MNTILQYIIKICIMLNILVPCFTENNIFLKPIDTCFLYTSYTNNYLYPFPGSNKIIIDKNTTLKLIDEIDYSNALFKDVLQVEVAQGYYKGKKGYILEEKLLISEENIDKGIYLFFKKDYTDEKNNIKINEKTKCTIIQSNINNNKEILTVKILSGKYNNQYIELDKKEYLHFIINKKTELFYHLRKNDCVFQIIDPVNFAPVKDAECNNILSDEYGILYLDNKHNQKLYIITKKDYTNGLIIPLSEKEQVFLCFMQQLELIKYYDDRTSIYKKSIFEFNINSKSSQAKAELGIKVLSQNDFSIFGYPFDIKDKEITGGFFIREHPASTNVDCIIRPGTTNIEILRYNTHSRKIEKVSNISEEGKIILKNIKHGYYIILRENKNREYYKLKIQNEVNEYPYKIFIRDKTGNYYFTGFSNGLPEITLPASVYEILFFSPDFPGNIFTEKIDVTYDTKINITEIIENSKHSEIKKLHDIYYSKWYRQKVKLNNDFIDYENNVLEYLGDMELYDLNRINFINDNYIMQGYFEIIDNKKMNIYLNHVSALIYNNEIRSNYLVTPSLFNSKIIIPAYYSQHLGIFQISFDNIYFKRKRIYNPEQNDDHLTIKMKSIPYGYPVFPESGEKSRYKIFFIQ